MRGIKGLCRTGIQVLVYAHDTLFPVDNQGIHTDFQKFLLYVSILCILLYVNLLSPFLWRFVTIWPNTTAYMGAKNRGAQHLALHRDDYVYHVPDYRL